MKYQSTKAKKFYKIYESLGYSRSLRKVAELSDGEISLTQLKRYSSKYNWIEQAKQHDIEVIKLEDAIEREQFKELLAVRKEQLVKYINLTDAVLKRLEKDVDNADVKSTSLANSIEQLTKAHKENIKLLYRMYGQAWNIDPLVINFIQQNHNQYNQANNYKLKK